MITGISYTFHGSCSRPCRTIEGTPIVIVYVTADVYGQTANGECCALLNLLDVNFPLLE